MGERKDLRDLLRDTDFTQKRIIDDLASSDIESLPTERGVAGDIRKTEGGDIIKNFFIGLLLVGIVVGSFWISFLIGKKILVPPVKSLPTVEIPVPKAISPAEIEKAMPVKEEPAVKEREIKGPVKTAAKAVKAPAAVATSKPAASKTAGIKYYKVVVGTYNTAAEANKMAGELKNKGFKCYIKKINGTFRAQAGAFDSREKAIPLVVKLKAKGFTPTIIAE